MSLLDFLHQHYDVRDVPGRPDEVRICCFSCGDTKHHGYFNLRKQVYQCYRCGVAAKLGGRGLTASQFLWKAHQIPWREARLILEGKRSVEVDIDRPMLQQARDLLSEGVPEEPEEGNQKEPEELDYPPNSWRMVLGMTSYLGRAAWQYLEDRWGEETPTVIDYFGVRYCSAGRYRGRIILPVWGAGGRMAYFQGRAFLPPALKPTYLNPEVERVLFLPYPNPIGRELILCEGYFDAIALGKGGTAVFGSTLTAAQEEQLRSISPRKVTVCFDSDSAGRKGALATCLRLREFIPEVSVVTALPEGKDPAALGLRSAREVVQRQAVPFGVQAQTRLTMKLL